MLQLRLTKLNQDESISPSGMTYLIQKTGPSKRLSKFKNVRLVEISGFDLKPIADASVDVLYCTVVFMHLEEWDRYNYVLEAYRVLRPGGRIYIDNFSLCTEEGWSVFETHRNIPAHLCWLHQIVQPIPD